MGNKSSIDEKQDTKPQQEDNEQQAHDEVEAEPKTDITQSEATTKDTDKSGDTTQDDAKQNEQKSTKITSALAQIDKDLLMPQQEDEPGSIEQTGNGDTSEQPGNIEDETNEDTQDKKDEDTEEKKEENKVKTNKIEMEDRTSYYFLNPHNLDLENDRDVVSVLALSDTLSTHSMEMMKDIPSVDILVHAGNFTHDGTLEQVQEFNVWLNHMLDTDKCKYALVVAGNHEIGFDGGIKDRNIVVAKNKNKEDDDMNVTAEGIPDEQIKKVESEANVEEEGVHKDNDAANVTTGKTEDVKVEDIAKQFRHTIKNAIYLEDQRIEILGLTFYGTPWNRVHGDNVSDHRAFCVATEDEMKNCFKNIPYDVDIMISHFPPYLHNDNVDGVNVGSKALIEKLYMDVEPFVCISGSIISCHGVSKQANMDTAFMNVNCSNEESEVAKKPILFYVQPKLESFF